MKQEAAIFQTSTIDTLPFSSINFNLFSCNYTCLHSASFVAQNKFAGQFSPRERPCRLRGRACGVDNLFPCCSSPSSENSPSSRTLQRSL